MRWAPAALLALLLPAAAGGQGTVAAGPAPVASAGSPTPVASGPPSSRPRPPDPGSGSITPSQVRAQGDKSVEDLLPEIVIEGGYYSGVFQGATGVHCEHRTGEIYVADPLANTVEIFSDTGAPLFAFSDDEHLAGPQRIAVDRDDRIYVIDSDRSRIKVFNYRGEFLDYFVPPGLGDQKPAFSAMLFDDNGDIYLGDTAAGRVLVYDAQLRQKVRFGAYGEGPDQFAGIVGIALDAAKNIYVCSQQGIAIQVFNRNGRLLRGWGHHDAGTHNVSLPTGIAVDEKGRVILADMLRQEIKYYDAQGALIGQFAGFGRQPGAIAYPSDLGLDRKGRICVADSGNLRIQVLLPVETVPTGDAVERRRIREAVQKLTNPVSAR